MTSDIVPVELREGVIALARQAAEEILTIYRTDFAVTRKDDDSPLTSADLAAHALLLAGLQRLTPDIPVLSEESSPEVATRLRRHWTRLWLVDPLDGTREFVKRNGEFTVNIALIAGAVAIFGVIVQPTTGSLWHGARGCGAFRRELGYAEDAQDPAQAMDTPIICRSPAPTALRVAVSRSHADTRSAALIARMGGVAAAPEGSSLKFCRIAQGQVDVYPRFGPTCEWDTAAGQAIVEAAGGIVINSEGDRLRYNQRDTLRNGDFLALGDPDLPWQDWMH